MAKYNVHAGHNAKVPGASKYLNEVAENRKVKNRVIALLKQQGHTVYDCTDDAGATQSKNLANIVAKCNKNNVTLDLSIHLNAGGGTGVEVLYYSAAGKAYAKKISAAIAKKLGLKDRGAKQRTGLYVLKNTKSTAVLVECCFVDSANDKKKWNADKCAQAIAEAVTGKTVSSSTPSGGNSDNIDGSFLVKIKAADLTIRSGAGTNYKAVGHIKDKGTYTITQVQYNGPTPWGKLKSKAGWISLHSAYVTRL